MSTLNLRKPGRPVHIGIILMNSETEVLDLAPIDLLYGMSKNMVEDFPSEIVSDDLKREALDLVFHWVNESGKPARLTSGLSINPTDTFASCPALDISLLGAHKLGYIPTEAEFGFIRKSYNDSVAFLNICGGMITSASAGVLDGKTCTGPRPFLPMFRNQFPKTTWIEKRYVNDGKVWTSGALLNGLDMMRAFIAETWGGSEPGKLLDILLQLGHVPIRDVDYKDAPSTL